MSSNVDSKVAVNEEPQMKVMGNAAGSRTTAGEQEANTNLSSRAEPSLGAMGNAAGFPEPHNASEFSEKSANNLVQDMTSLIRRYPLPSLLAGIGVGYLLFSRRSLR